VDSHLLGLSIFCALISNKYDLYMEGGDLLEKGYFSYHLRRFIDFGIQIKQSKNRSGGHAAFAVYWCGYWRCEK
jgi:hypothetical protein